MLGSPPASAAALPSFLVEDSDFLPAWSKALSASPRLDPAAGPSGGPGTSSSASRTGLDAFGLDPKGDHGASQDTAMLDASHVPSPHDVGNGLSPVLGPTLMSASPHPLERRQDDDVGDLSGAYDGQHRSSFESSFNKFHRPPVSDAPTPHKSPVRRKSSHSDLSAPLSFANVATLPSLSPIVPPVGAISPIDGPATSAPAASALRSPNLHDPKLESQSSANFAHGLPSGLQRRATLGAAVDEQDKGKIQAYAKLEFPSFDIYIQKLSVTIGRRPAAPPSRSPASALPFDDAHAAGLSLEDYILSLTDAALVKREETLASIDPAAPVPSSTGVKGKEKAVDDDPFLEFVRSSPPPSTSIRAEAPLAVTSFPPLPPRPTSAVSAVPIAPAPPLTDVDLGPLRAVSRQHARLSFDYDVGAWVIEVLGRNGVVVEGKWRAKGQKAVLTKKTKIQIAERIFHFVLPTIDVVAVEADGAAEPSAKPIKGAVKDKSRLRAPGRGKGKGKGKGKSKAKKRAAGEGDASSSLSEVSDSDLELSPLKQPSLELSASPQKVVSAPSAPPTAPSNASADAAASVPAPAPPSRPASTPAPTRSSSAGKGQAAPPHHVAPVASSSSTPAAVKPRPPLPHKVPATRSSKKPKPAPTVASPVTSHLSQHRGPVPDEDEIEEARSRAAMIAQILSGRGVAGMSNAALVRAAAEAQRRQSGKGKAPMRSAGKGPGKGKGLPPRPRRPSNASWDDDDDDDESMSSDSGDSDHELLIEAFQEAANMGHDIRGGGQGGGKHHVQRTASDATLNTMVAPAPVPSPATTSAPVPKLAGKMPAKQPRARRNASVSGPATSSGPAASASPAATLSTNLPPLPLPTLPDPTPSPAPPTPAMLYASSLPPLPELVLADASPASPAFNLPPIPKPTSTPLLSHASPALDVVDAKSPAPPASNTALPLAPPPPPPAAPSVPAASTPATALAKKRSHKKKVAPKEGDAVVAGESAPATATAAAAAPGPDGAAAPAKPRPSPYAPAPLAPGTTPPDEAPADNRQTKPPYTYASLIAQAIMGSEAKKMTLHEVYDWIVERWPYFGANQAGWQNSIRHNLTPARGFLKVVRKADEPGKGAFWELDPAQVHNFDGHHFRIKKTEGAAAVAAAASAASAAATKAAKAGAAPSPSPGPAAAPSPAIVAAVEASTAATASAPAKPKTAAASSSAAPAAVKAKGHAKSTSSRPSSASPAPQSAAAQAQLSKPLPIVISALPASFVPPTPPPESTSAAATDELTASLLANPPIVLHEGKLILRPEIFAASLSGARLAELQKMPASAVLPVLQAHVVQHFKDKLRAKGTITAQPAPAKPPKAAAKAPKSSSKAPRTAAAHKKPKTVASSSSTAASSTAAPAPVTAGTKRAREADVDLSASTSSSTKPAKAAKKAAPAPSTSR
ncbi:hypothetical protein JCM3775_006644 [Rhodotorula graminis]